ncbi:MAG: GldG family protein [Candidatus Dadabacteria bacterium]|nr:GldG family protein [Candidatus Dadabacteria bacterium]
MRRRKLIYGTGAFISVVSTLGIIIVLNYLLFRTDVRFDVTEGKFHTVSAQTVRVLKSVEGEIEIIGFFKDTGVDREGFQDLAKEYSHRNDNIKVSLVNPDKEPGIAKKYGVKEYGSVVIERGDKAVKLRLTDPITGGILNNSEEKITNAILKLTRESQKTLYFLTGHGQRDMGNSVDAEGLGLLRRTIIDEGYNVKEFLILRGEELPRENAILFVAAPIKAFSLKEILYIKNYLNRGGRAVFLIEPRSGNEIASVLKGYGFELSDDVIIDPSSKLEGGGDIAPIVSDYPYHEITEDFRFATIFPYSRSIDVLSDFNATVLASTGEYSWSETDFELFNEGVAQREESDKGGPLGVAAVVENSAKGRIAVFGSADFVSNIFLEFSGNRDFFLNTLNWVSGDENLISIRPKAVNTGNLTITTKQVNLIFLFTVVIIPAVILSSGLVIWWKRRRL